MDPKFISNLIQIFTEVKNFDKFQTSVAYACKITAISFVKFRLLRLIILVLHHGNRNQLGSLSLLFGLKPDGLGTLRKEKNKKTKLMR